MSGTCSSCGALLADGAVRCDLCGTPVEGVVDDVAAGTTEETPREAEAPAEISEDPAGVVFCNQCGWKNPSGSRFCSSCGAALQQVASVAVAEAAAPVAAAAGRKSPTKPDAPVPGKPAAPVADTSVGRRLGMIFGAAVLVVVAIFLIDAVSGGDASTQERVGASAPAAPVSSDTPLADDVADQLETIKAEAERLDGEQRVARLRDGVQLLLSVGRFDRAGAEQEAVAEITGSEEDWSETGNHYYDWMDQQFGPERVAFAKKAIAAYRKALEINPDNLDVRTDMAVAYMSDPDNPMLAIQENAAVLEQDSLHVQANFNRGIMLLQINRVDQAVDQFRKVQRIVGDPDAPLYQLAEQAIISIEQGGAAPLN